MSASYWSSTQRRYWTFTKPELAELRRKLDEQERGLITQYPLPERRLLNIYFNLRRVSLVPFLSMKLIFAQRLLN